MERSQPIFVTGMPRSGTTWLARLLATAAGSSLAGREPLNPRGRQYALGHTLDGWAHLERLSPRQRRLLKLSYLGLNPLVYSRYGRRQWAAPLPWSRVVVKDPFALLSIPAVVEATSAQTVLVFRHPGAVLTSYRRMGWQPDLDELQPIVRAHPAYGSETGLALDDLPGPGETSDAEAMGRFWSALYTMALYDIDEVPDLLVLSHEDVATNGIPGVRRLFAKLNLDITAQTREELHKESAPANSPSQGLHNFDRAPSEVATAWRTRLEPREVDDIEKVSTVVLTELERRRFPLFAPQ